MLITEENMDFLIEELVNQIKELPNKTEICLVELLNMKYKFIGIEKIMIIL